MLKKWFVPLFIMLSLVFAQSGGTQPLEMRVGEGDSSRLSFQGFGELHYNNPKGTGVPVDTDADQIDFHRMGLGWTFEFDDRVILHARINLEQDESRDLALEFAYLDFLINPLINVRAGSMLMPVGPLNEYHEPLLFYSVERPYVQTHIIPSTWQEGGAGFFGSPLPGLTYRVYVVSSLNSEKFTSSSGIRGGRSKGAKADSSDISIVARVEYTPIQGLDFGVSFYDGGADATKAVQFSPRVGIFEGDVRFQMAGVDFQWLYVKIDIDDAFAINAFNARAGNSGEEIGKELVGSYLELAYHLSHLMGSEWDLVPFIRLEDFNTHEEVPAGFTADPANDRQVHTVGLAYYPQPRVVLKVDLENWEDEAGGDNDRYNLGMAFMF